MQATETRYRTHSCGQLRKTDVGQTVKLAGWVQSYRDHGGLVFIDLRDREGIAQVVFHPEQAAAHATARQLRNEDVVVVRGRVVERGPGSVNPKIPTGEIEVTVEEVKLANKADAPPFLPS